MIDIEDKVIDTVSKSLKTDNKTKDMNIFLSSVTVNTTAKLPAVFIYESDNATYTGSLDISLHEHHATITYDVDIYAGNVTGRKAAAKCIRDVVDKTMQNMKFTRILMTPLPNYDRSIYRYKLRYRGVVQQPVSTETKITYQMYRG